LGSKKLVFQEVDVNPNEIQTSNKKTSSLSPSQTQNIAEFGS
jgi:hypothetical protein